MKALLAAILAAGAALANQNSAIIPPALQGIGIDQKLNQNLPLDLRFRDESGKSVALRSYFGQRPVVLALVYYDCPMLCTMVLNGLLRTMRAVNLSAGTDYEVVTVSFDPRETPQLAAAKKGFYVEKYRRPSGGAGWHFLTGDQPSISALTQAAGFRYKWDEKSRQFAHASGIMVATPGGRLSHYFYGLEYPPRDFRLALVEASQNRIGSPVDEILLYCFHYDAATGRYSLAVMNILRALALATVAVMLGFVFVSLRRDKRKLRSSYS